MTMTTHEDAAATREIFDGPADRVAGAALQRIRGLEDLVTNILSVTLGPLGGYQRTDEDKVRAIQHLICPPPSSTEDRP